MAGVLITGFEPFGGETVNPSWEVVKQLDGMIIRGQQVVAKQLPCVFGEALTVLEGGAGNLSTAADDCRRTGRAAVSISPSNV
ncbi:pyroglutamyl-peptidase I [Klebsiella pneumoniae]|uniref:Pyroglutamyl-peptidase I n=1 Tax=Klebsiella pneumoniae TaxID=573 RepID=A0A2X3EPQ0_KLEPN|nr:pyroglutamyl-peptidase I [Klebsiella pneumoniae]